MADTTPRGYPFPEGSDVWRADAEADGGAPWKNLAEAVDADVAAVEAAASGATSSVAGDLADHEAATTSVHGIANTANLVTTARTVSAGTGLTGGGTLASDRTIGIAAGGVGTTELANDAVTSAKIADGTIATGDIANGAVTDAKLAGSITPSKVTGTAVVEARQITAGTGLTGGGDLSTNRTISIAAGGVGTTQLADDAVTTGKIATGAVGTTDIADSAVTSAKIADGTIVDADVNASAAIAPTKIAGTAVVQARTVTGTGSLTGGGDLSANRTLDVAAGGIGTTQLANAGVTEAKLATAAVTTAKIADGAITLGKLDPGASVVPSATVGNLLPANVATGTDTLSSTAGYTFSGCTGASSTDYHKSGVRSLQVTATATGAVVHVSAATIAVTPGATVTMVAHALAPTVTKRIRATMVWYQADGTTFISQDLATGVALTTSWQRYDLTAVAPAGAAFVVARLIREDSFTAGDVFYTDEWSLHLGAGGLWVPPGIPVPNLGIRADPTNAAQVQVWNPGNNTWITV